MGSRCESLTVTGCARTWQQRVGCATQAELGVTSDQPCLEFTVAPVPVMSRERRADHHPPGTTACRADQSAPIHQGQLRYTRCPHAVGQLACNHARGEWWHTDTNTAQTPRPQPFPLAGRVYVHRQDDADDAASETPQPALHGGSDVRDVIQQQDASVHVGGSPQPSACRAASQSARGHVAIGTLQRTGDVIQTLRRDAIGAMAGVQQPLHLVQQRRLAAPARTPQRDVLASAQPAVRYPR